MQEVRTRDHEEAAASAMDAQGARKKKG